MIHIFKDVLPDPIAYRDAALAGDFQDRQVGEAVFKGIAMCPDATVHTLIVNTFPQLAPTISFVRQSPFEQLEPNYIHTDRDMKVDWTAILYLSPNPPAGDGTDFWTHLPSDSNASSAVFFEEFMAEWNDWRSAALWKRYCHVEAEFNQLIIFPSSLYHSRAIFENYGEGSSARLTQVTFGHGTLPPLMQEIT